LLALVETVASGWTLPTEREKLTHVRNLWFRAYAKRGDECWLLFLSFPFWGWAGGFWLMQF